MQKLKYVGQIALWLFIITYKNIQGEYYQEISILEETEIISFI